MTEGIKIDVTKLGPPWFVDEEKNTWLMYDEIVIGHNSALNNQVAIHLLFKGQHVYAQAVPGFPGFVDPKGIIHVTEVNGRMRLDVAILPQVTP